MRQGASDVVPFPKRTLRTLLVALGLSMASGAVYKFVRVGSIMYAGGASSSVSTPAGVSPGGTFTRSNIVAFNASTGVISSFPPSVNGGVWALASDGSSLWIGRTFTSVNGTARRGVAKLNPATGANLGRRLVLPAAAEPLPGREPARLHARRRLLARRSWFAFVSTGYIPQSGGVGRDLCRPAGASP